MTRLRDAARRAVLRVAAPALTHLDLRFADLTTELRERSNDLDAHVARGDQLNDIATAVDRQLTTLGAVGDDVERIAAALGVDGGPPAHVSKLTHAHAELINRLIAHDGYAAQAGVWINHPLWLSAAAGRMFHAGSNERFLEIPFVLHHALHHGVGRVLDVGCCESLVPLHLASMGLEVTALDPRPYGFEHPDLRTVVGTIEDFDDPASFDLVVFLSTIEHIGLPAYGITPFDDGDHRAMAAATRLLAPGGRIVLTVPYGAAETTDFERTYDRERLLELCRPGRIESAMIGVRSSPTVWAKEADDLIDAADDRLRVAMVVVRFSQ